LHCYFFRYGYGNWKDIASHVETKTPEQAKEEYIRQYIYGSVGKHTWREELRGFAVDHTQAADRGPLSPTLTSKLPPISVSSQEAILVIRSAFLVRFLTLRKDFLPPDGVV
jgi:transcriptional adapter 2-beta